MNQILLLAGAIALVGALSIELFRSRPSFGKSRRLPPGSFGWLVSVRGLRDYDFYRHQFERFGPVFKASQHHRPVVCVLGIDRARRTLTRHRTELRPAPLPINRYTTGGLLRFMSAEQHRKYRDLLRSCMTREVIVRCEPLIEKQARRMLARMTAQSSHGEHDVHGSALMPSVDDFVFGVCAGVFLGLDSEDTGCKTLRELYRVIDYRRPWLRPSATRRELGRLAAFVRDQAGQLEASGELDGSFLGAAMKGSNEALADTVFVENLAYFLHIARNDAGGLISWVLKMAADHPEWAKRVRDDESVAERFVAETLRLRQSEYLYRQTIAPIEIDDYLIPPGWLVRFCIRESHTDDSLFDNARTFDPDRFLDGEFRNSYQPFGLDEHACLGVHMAKMIATVTLRTLVLDFDWDSVADGRMQSGIHHHRHWRPNASFRLRLTERVSSRPE